MYNELLGQWVFSVLNKHFEDQKNENTNKIFIKINGLSANHIEAVLNNLHEKNDILEKYYTPIIRTIKPVEDYSQYSLQPIETSTWLRNNTQSGHALVMIINELTPEAQSLENLFSIDEAYLLSENGFEVLYSILSTEYKYAAEEIDTIKEFINMYNKLAEPQLRTLLRFLDNVIRDSSPSIVQKIQANLLELNLFKDSQLVIGKQGIKRLKSNYLLANLQKQSGQLDPERLQNNLYSFLDKEESNEYNSELWNVVRPEDFERYALDFINQKDQALLNFEYEIIESVFNFRVVTSLPEKIYTALPTETYTDEQKQKAEDGIAAVEKNDNPDEMQEFLEEFETDLVGNSQLVKTITRRIEKLRHPKDYHDLIEALLYETFEMIEEHSDKLNSSNFRFELSIKTRKAPENIKQLLNIYLSNIEKVVPSIFIKDGAVNGIGTDEAVNDKFILLGLKLIVNGEQIAKENFKLTGLHTLVLSSLIDPILSGKLPYIKEYQDEELEVLDVASELTTNVEGYLSINEKGMQEHYDMFTSFLSYHLRILKQIIEHGAFSVDINEYENKLASLLQGVHSSVTICSFIYKHLNYIGAIDSLDIKQGQAGYGYERLLTIFNPIRLVSYLHRYKALQNNINEWVLKAENDQLEVTNLTDYLSHVRERTLNLAPRYFSSDGDDSFLLENNEVLGEGSFILNTRRNENMDHLSQELSEELIKTVSGYFEVYPYAKDGLDILFLYCQSSEIIIKSIDLLYKKFKDLTKLKITVHSTKAAQLHQRINQWLMLKEEYANPGGSSKFPKVEVKIISGNSINQISSQIKENMVDADLVVLADYFGQSNQIKYEFDKIDVKSDNEWFGVVYKEPLLKTEVMKKISYISETLPTPLKDFYQLQYIYQKKEMLEDDELYVLKNKISLSNFSDNELIDFMHDNFNWIMFMDRYLDKSLLEKASSKAQIIQYKSKAGSNKNYKLIVSSSEYIKKLNSKEDDYEYFDRLGKKLSLVLKNKTVKKENIVEAVNNVKSISGALVLKAIGPGKYSHELMATHLSKQQRQVDEKDLQVWSVCDELPWFAKNKKRPDLVITTIKETNDKLLVNFELLELKFINLSIFERERYDAIKQVQQGMLVYEKLFNFNDGKADSDYWKNELIHYFIEREAYSPEHAHLLKKLQETNVNSIEVDISSSIDVYCYTSNLNQYGFESISEGVFVEMLEGEYKNNIFNRAYILNALGVTELDEPKYDEFDSTFSSFHRNLEETYEDRIIDENDEEGHPEDGEGDTNTPSDLSVTNSTEPNNAEGEEPTKDPMPEEIGIEDTPEKGQDARVTDTDEVATKENDSQSLRYPEVIALSGVELDHEEPNHDHTEVKRKYVSNIERHFNRNNLNVKVKEVIVGSTVIRLILSIPSSISIDKITRRRQDIQLWLELDQEPHMFIDKNGLNIDILREDPDIVYFEEFMKITRAQLNDKVKDTNLLAPLGVDPLNNAISIDFSNPTTPHLLTGGTTGSGKSVTLNSIILGTMCLYDTSKLQFVFIDPKQVEFTVYNNLPHTKAVITDINEAVATLDRLVDEMESRYQLFAEEFVSNLDEYVSETKNTLPRILVVFDEFADFMSQDKEIAQKVENAILRLGQKARAAGIHLIICTQNPKSDIINTNIRNNLGARLALRATDSTASNVILGDSGAENLGGKGDFLAKTASQKVIRGKSPFLTPKVKRALLKHFKQADK
ncbi:FtsK/SpoIIIE domain-containing protein [Alkalihalophilus marmarensis]|uniref:FtsK/SpoIIIE domain-containing protein n=1 Tax=Alkalihalophilus marmarensis TaxID=521377 RepID=UPI002E222CC4|nr:FtsK/SpoIIIE domain-containing protein [Alkalihalophilus marmarensis]MED1603283.1 FtsK/SpoIIIE domain-containing protein [Alkalihalophilus marmarensis]